MNKRILIYGSFKSPVSPLEFQIINSLVEVIISREHSIVNASGKYLGQYVAQKLLIIADCKPSLGIIHKQYLTPDGEQLTNHYSIESFRQLMHGHHLRMMNETTPSLCVIIGGSDNAHALWQVAKEQQVPVLGIPSFGGVGKEIYEACAESIEQLEDEKVLNAYNALRNHVHNEKATSIRYALDIAQAIDALVYCKTVPA